MIEIGKTYNAWTVIQDLGTRKVGKSTRHFYLCECVCGTRKEVRSDNLTSGHSNGCGCLRKKLNPETWKQKSQDDKSYIPRHGESIIGKTFGELYVMNFDHTDTGLKSWFKCRCSCGREELKRMDYLRVNGVNACSECLNRISTGELAVRTFLEQHSIHYKEQVSFSDLRGDAGVLRFDFVLYKENKIVACIEFQGRQHYTAIDFFGGEERYQKQVKYDNKKRAWCATNNYHLYEIPYWEYHNIDAVLNSIINEVYK